MKPTWPPVEPTKLVDTFKGWRDGVLYPLAKMSDQLKQMLSGGLTFTENMNASVIEFDAQHGVEALFLPPDKMKSPLTFIPINALLATGADIQISSKSVLNYRPTVSGIPRTDGRLGITLQYDLAHTLPSLVRSFNISRASGAGFADIAPFTAVSSRGSIITESAGTWTVSEAGQYLITGYALFAVGGYSNIAFRINGTIVNACYAALDAAITAASLTSLVVNACERLPAGATFTFPISQTNSGAAARTVQGRCSVSRLYNDTIPTARVRGILIGA